MARTRQPQTVPRIAAQYAAYAKSVIVGGIPFDLARNVALPSGLTQSVNGNGRTFITPTPRYAIASECDAVLPTGGDVTILWQNKHANMQSTPGATGNDTPAGTNEFNIYLPYGGDGKVYFRWAGESEGSTSLSVASLSFGIDDWWAFTAGSRGMEIWQNGIKVGSNSGTPSRTTAAGKPLYVGCSFNTFGEEATETFSLFSILSTQLPTNFLAQKNYWSLFAPQRRLWIQLGAAAGGSETTGTLSGTDGADAAAFSGAESIPGSLAATDGADAATFSGTHVENATGTLAATDGADVAAFAGTETFTGTLAATDGADAAAFTGQHTEAGVISGSLAATDGADAAAFDGVQTISGALAATDGADAGAFTGIHLQNITSTLDATDGADGATFSGTTAAEITGTLDATDGADEALFVSDQLGGRLLRRRRRYLIKDRVYNDLDPADVIAAAKEAGVDLGDVREVVKEPVQRKADPRHADDEGREYWLPQEFWGRAARQQRQEATSPLPADFWRAVEAIRPSGGPMVAASALQAQALRQRQEDEALLLLLS